MAQLAYGDPALRRYRDLDILVRGTDADAACDALAALGFRNADAFTPAQRAAFRRYSGQDIVFRDGVAVEPHWALAPRTLSLQVDHDALFARARDVELARYAVRCFGAEDLVAVLCLHGSKEQWTRLLWIADLAHMIAASPEPRLGCACWTARASRAACAWCWSAWRWLQRCSMDCRRRSNAPIADDREARALAEWVASRLFDPDRADPSIYTLTAFRLRMRERMADRLRYVARTIATARDIHFSLLRLPDALFFLYTPLKLVHDYVLLPVWTLGKRARQSHRG